MRHGALLLLVLVLSAPLARAGIEERDLPDGWKGPTFVRFDDEGRLWMALDGSWALGRYHPDTDTGDLFPLPMDKPDARSAMGRPLLAEDGGVWVGTPTHVLRLDPATGDWREFPLPGRILIAGDVYLAPDGMVWYALTDKDILLKLDPASGAMTQYPMPDKPFGPLEFVETEDGFYLTATYANTYARFDPATGAIAIASVQVAGPVGIDEGEPGQLWIAEMGASSVSTVRHETGDLVRFPTTPSPYYPLSGPAGIVILPDGRVWFVEHFADRVSLLDPNARTLHEYEVPSAPGTNVQYLAQAPDGSLWTAEASTHKLARATFTNEPVHDKGPDSITLTQGTSARFELGAAPAGHWVAHAASTNLNATIVDDALVVTAQGARVGEHLILLSLDEGSHAIGRYVPLSVVAAPQETPAAPLALLLATLGVLALARRRAA